GSADDLLTVTAKGLYCPLGDFYIDPWRPVEGAGGTHAHGDHARPGGAAYWCAAGGLGVARRGLGGEARAHVGGYGATFELRGVGVSLHPAGHILGSAQVRVEALGGVWVVTGDYKRDADPTCRGFEVVRADVLVTEATFALPIYRWRPVEDVVRGV